MFKVPNAYRDRIHPLLGSGNSAGNSGLFIIPHKMLGYEYRVIASDGMEWEHVSVQIGRIGFSAERCPTWEEMCYIKNLFWDESDCVIQYHPSKDQYVNRHPYVLHLWRPINQSIPIPSKQLVG